MSIMKTGWPLQVSETKPGERSRPKCPKLPLVLTSQSTTPVEGWQPEDDEGNALDWASLPALDQDATEAPYWLRNTGSLPARLGYLIKGKLSAPEVHAINEKQQEKFRVQAADVVNAAEPSRPKTMQGATSVAYAEARAVGLARQAKKREERSIAEREQQEKKTPGGLRPR